MVSVRQQRRSNELKRLVYLGGVFLLTLVTAILNVYVTLNQGGCGLRPPSILGPKRYLLARNTTSSSTTVHDDDAGRRKRARFLDGIFCQGLIGPVGPLNVEESPLPSRIH